MATFEATFQSDCEIDVRFIEQSSFSVSFETIIERVPPNYGLITRIGNAIRVS